MIVVQDIAFVRYQAPDLDAMEGFLEEFGLLRVARSQTALFMRGYGPEPFVHVTELGEPKTLGFGLKARSAEDLSTLAARLGKSVEPNPEPSGGLRVRFTDPAGFTVDVLHGQLAAAGVAHREPFAANPLQARRRVGQTIRQSPAPAHVERLGHVLAHVADLKACLAFYTGELGFRPSDIYFAGHPDNTAGVFLHCGLGQRWTDHHTLAFVAARDGRSRFDHSAFEVLDLDDLVQGGEHLRVRGRTRSWGVGRHVQGSQIFDYWRDPCDNKIEHWTDGDLVNDDTPVGRAEFSPEGLSQWGPPITPDFLR
jgi:catechol 2,3-dioxygenase-like lactoylglutathione lyase family enzyme